MKKISIILALFTSVTLSAKNQEPNWRQRSSAIIVWGILFNCNPQLSKKILTDLLNGK
jgi:hypothetical protein